MLLKSLMSYLVLISLLFSTQAQADVTVPLMLAAKTYGKYKEKKAIEKKLEHIQENLAEMKSDINLIINNHLKSALTALDEAQHMKSDAEKIDSIRSAKHHLTEAINIEKEPQRRALAIYLKGQVYLLLDEHQNAKIQFQNVVHFTFGEQQGVWDKTTVYDPKITQLKVDATGILCAFNEKATAIKNNWCALHVGYRAAPSIPLKDLEHCVASEDAASCERVGYRLLKTYIDQNRLANIQDPLILADPFKKEYSSSVTLSKDFLFKSCDPQQIQELPSIDHYRGCYWRAQVLLHQQKHTKLLNHHKFLCKSWLDAQQNDADEEWITAVRSEGERACKALYKAPLWSALSKGDKTLYTKPLCLQGDRVACAQLLRDTHFYHSDLGDDISTYLGQQCLVKEDQRFCQIIDDTLKLEHHPMKLNLTKIVIGLNTEGKLWDMTGDSNPEVLLIIRMGSMLVYHQRLDIKSINTDASRNPLSYLLTLKPDHSLPIYLDYAKRHKLEVIFTDIDAYEDDLISSRMFNYDEFKSFQGKFGSVQHISMSLEPVKSTLIK